MNAFVAGNVNEVKKLGTILIEAVNAADQSIEGRDVENQYKDGKVSITYKPIVITNE